MESTPIRPFTIDFDLVTGLCASGKAKPTHRFVSNMISQFHDHAAAEEIVKNGDMPIYDFFELGGDSLSTALAAAELETIGVDYRDIYAWKKPREIAARLSDKGEADLDALSRAALGRNQYLTPYQTYFYDAMLYSPAQDATSNPFTLRFPREAVEPERLKAALEAVFANYALFSTVCGHDAEGVPVLRHVPGRIVHPEIREVDAHTVDMLMARFNREDYLCNPVPDLHSRRTGNGQHAGRTPCTLGELQRGCEALGTSPNKLFVAAALIMLSRHSGHDRVTVEWTYNGRDENWKQDLVGMTIASVPVAVDIHSPQDLLKEIDAQNALGMRYAGLSLGNNGVTPGERDRTIVVYESGFDLGAALPEGTELSAAYDRLNGAFTRCQIILFNTGDPNTPMPYYINYDSELNSRALVERLCECYNAAITWMISGGKQ